MPKVAFKSRLESGFQVKVFEGRKVQDRKITRIRLSVPVALPHGMVDAPSAKRQKADGGQAGPVRTGLVRRVFELCGDSGGSLGADGFFKLRESNINRVCRL